MFLKMLICYQNKRIRTKRRLFRKFLICPFDFNGTFFVNLVLDSEGKPGSGVMDGNTQWIGRYPECLRVRAHTEYTFITTNVTTTKTRRFRGKYCKSYWDIRIEGEVRFLKCI